MNVISLFCGPGGLDLGFTQAGFSVRLAFDIDGACVETHKLNHPETTSKKADLSKISAEEIINAWTEVNSSQPIGLIGGPPCQSFSIGNVHKREDDPRNNLPQHYARILRGINKQYNIDFFAFENVPGILKSAHAEQYKKFKNSCRRAGFRVFEKILDAQHFGVPQTRPRIFVVGINGRKFPKIEFRFPDEQTYTPRIVGDVLRDLPDATLFQRGMTCDVVSYHRNHWCMYPKSEKFRNGLLKNEHVSGRSFKVLSWDKVSPTVAYGNREVHIHPNGTRRLSVYEAMLLQGFPKDYFLTGTLTDQIRLVSEAVSPPVAKALAESIVRQLYVSGV